MAKKIIVTDKEIEKDIITALKYPPKAPRSFYKDDTHISTVIGIALGLVLVVLEFMFMETVLKGLLWFLFVVFVYAMIVGIFNFFHLRYQIKNVSVNDYEITTETVHSISDEHFAIKRGTRRFRRYEIIHNYNIRFENGKEWRMPKENYNWSSKYSVSDWGAFQEAHRGDTFIVVTQKSSGKIIMAYDTDIFEYKEDI